MSPWLIGALVIAAAGGAYLFASSRAAPTLPPDTRSDGLGGAVDQGSQERTAWANALSSLFSATGQVAGAIGQANAQGNATRQAAGGSTPK